LGFAATPVSETLGVASAIQMCRSVIIKGMEAIVIESYLCARKHGVEQQVLDSLAETFPGIDWEKQGTYFFSRVVQHGRRRAEEMREAAAMVAEAGFAPFMAAATAERHAWVATWAADDPAATSSKLPLPWREVADRMIRAQKD
jgi:3-hydroxyisobutyrate dehydrogenase-like beta-hydroxyacid dehydrogenase